jgi:hypothetical protein
LDVFEGICRTKMHQGTGRLREPSVNGNSSDCDNRKREGDRIRGRLEQETATFHPSADQLQDGAIQASAGDNRRLGQTGQEEFGIDFAPH